MNMTSLQSDDRFSEEFFNDLYHRFGVEDEDYFMRVIGKTVHHYYIKLEHADGIEQILYKKDNHTWEFIT